VIPRSYVIDVCRYCFAQAKWPGCEHWQIHADWCMPVHVGLAPGERRRLAAASLDHHDQRKDR
jgi:hypothetical protein